MVSSKIVFMSTPTSLDVYCLSYITAVIANQDNTIYSRRAWHQNGVAWTGNVLTDTAAQAPVPIHFTCQ
jgi:hypothetical protein